MKSSLPPTGLARTCGRGFLLALVLFAFPGWICAQTRGGVVRGTIKDSAGAVLSRARVTLTGARGASMLYAVTDAQGAYQIPSVRPGEYTVRVSRLGYQPVFKEKFFVRGGRGETLDLIMNVRHGSAKARPSSLNGFCFYEPGDFKAAPLADPAGGGGHSSQSSRSGAPTGTPAARKGVRKSEP